MPRACKPLRIYTFKVLQYQHYSLEIVENSAWGERVWKVRASSSWLWCRNQGWKQKEDIVVAISNFLQAPAPFLLSLVPNPGNEPSSSKAFLQQQDAHLVRMDCGSDDSWFRRTKHWADIKNSQLSGNCNGNCEIDLAFLLPFPLCHLDMFSFPVFMHGLYSLQANEKQAPSKARSLDGHRLDDVKKTPDQETLW